MLSFGGFASKIFGSSNERKVKVFRPRVAAINALESEVENRPMTSCTPAR